MNVYAVPFGITITLAAGFLQGSFALFLKKMYPWKWENFWVIYSLVAFFLFPFVWALIAIPNLVDILFSLTPDSIVVPLTFGAMWGIGSVLFGLSVVRIGVTLTYSIIISMTGVLGTIIPLFLNRTLPPFQTLVILTTGLLVMLLGLLISGYAGALREKRQKEGKTSHSKTYWIGLMIAIVSGIMSPMLNVGFSSGKQISEVALKFGASASNATLPIWVVVLFGGFLINIGYALYLLFMNKSFVFFLYPNIRPTVSAILSGLFWFGGIGLFGIATVALGSLGTSVGWAILMGSMIIVSSFWGIVTGEWKGTRKALQVQVASVLILVVGIVIIASALFH
jgi:L-rhamnose-proton symport protein RhaT